jgi:hypothetical protein
VSFGNDVIVFKHVRKVPDAAADDFGNFPMETVDTPAPGCRHRPLSFKEIVELEFDVSTELWRSTLPLKDYDGTLLAIVVNAKAYDFITVNGEPYQIIGGVRPHGDMASVPFKMTIISQKQTG